ncbi:hypothetical protein OG401_11625 [Kitasatospora purpeofusca]|uniref:hypothetical protein n=1 Tax=Kitasatospora purpeofusca TaxID=67352 RepID=UPI0022517A58|nr:hypothetical protein [Kitasatospora purpeofusca]MCX4684948.1 hypothetical protein [Kitasatospora purpeofusca]
MATDRPIALGPRLSRGRIVGLAVTAVFVVAAGWLTATGLVRAFATDACGAERHCAALPTIGLLVAGPLLWPATLVAAASTAHGDAPTTEPSATSDRGVLLGCLAVGLLGAALANGAPHLWLFAPVLPLALLAAALDRHGARRWRAHRPATEQQDRLEQEGITVPALITLAAPTTSPRDGDVVSALERLAALHREGALDAAEFTAAKALLLRGGVSAGASGGL